MGERISIADKKTLDEVNKKLDNIYNPKDYDRIYYYFRGKYFSEVKNNVILEINGDGYFESFFIEVVLRDQDKSKNKIILTIDDEEINLVNLAKFDSDYYCARYGYYNTHDVDACESFYRDCRALCDKKFFKKMKLEIKELSNINTGEKNTWFNCRLIGGIKK